MLNALELAVETTPERFPPSAEEDIRITREVAEESIQRRAVLYDKEGDYHFDTISAFIKSLRGSDPDAAIYWLAKMVYAGEDPRFLFRRMLIFAGEDIGMDLPARGHYGVGMAFLPVDPEEQHACEQVLERVAEEEGQKVLGWRTVPIDSLHLGPTARAAA